MVKVLGINLTYILSRIRKTHGPKSVGFRVCKTRDRK